MVSVEVMDSHDLDYETYSNLHKEAFSELLSRLRYDDAFMTPQYYQWKYHPPAGSAKIAVVLEDGKMVATNGMFPLHIRYGDFSIRGWQSCDTATLPSSRGKGYYVRCLRALEKEVRPNEIFFGFPNRNSLPGFAKAGCQERGVITTWVNPFPCKGKWVSVNITQVMRFDYRQDLLAEQFTQLGGPMLDRGSAYMNWRYHDHPIYKYTSFVYQKDGNWQGFAVARRVEAMGREAALIMELWGLFPEVLRSLLGHMVGWAKGQSLKMVAILDNSLAPGNALRAGFFPIPSRFLPKRLVLMGYAKGGEAETIMKKKWRVQAGDWDTF